MKEHGKSWGVTWYSEQCWIYDHPRAGTVYSRGFLFPLEASKIMHEWNPFVSPEADPDVSGKDTDDSEKGRERDQEITKLELEDDSARPEFRRRYEAAYSTVVRAQYRRSHPSNSAAVGLGLFTSSEISPLSPSYALKRAMELDALIEGSKLSMVVADVDSDADIARRWKGDLELGWKGLYMLEKPDGFTPPLGGTVVVHYVQSSVHWRECTDVLLLGWELGRRDMSAALALPH
jgi:hypothetical protein